MRVDVHEAAVEEAVAATTWYDAQSPDAARAFQREIATALRAIREAPRRFPQHVHGTRRFLLSTFPYEIVYRVGDDHVLVIAIAHSSRRPGYWRRR